MTTEKAAYRLRTALQLRARNKELEAELAVVKTAGREAVRVGLEWTNRAERAEAERDKAIRALHHHSDCNEAKALKAELAEAQRMALNRLEEWKEMLARAEKAEKERNDWIRETGFYKSRFEEVLRERDALKAVAER